MLDHGTHSVLQEPEGCAAKHLAGGLSIARPALQVLWRSRAAALMPRGLVYLGFAEGIPALDVACCGRGTASRPHALVTSHLYTLIMLRGCRCLATLAALAYI